MKNVVDLERIQIVVKICFVKNLYLKISKIVKHSKKVNFLASLSLILKLESLIVIQ